MADTKTTALVELTDPIETDLVYVIDNPGGTPLSKKMTIGNLKTHLDSEKTSWGTGDDVDIEFNGTDFVLDYDHANSGTSDFRLQEDGTDMLTVLTGGNTTIAQNLTVTGVVTGSTFDATSATADGDNASLGYEAAKGAVLTGQGSTDDITFENDAGLKVFGVPTGTTIIDGLSELKFTERADHISTPGATFGYLWVKSDAPSSLIYTADDGTDTDLTAGAAFDSTAVDATTWSDAANASNTWTFDVSGTNTTCIFGSANWRIGATTLEVRAVAAAAGTLLLSTEELTVVDGDELGRINFQAPLESDGTDAILVAASIHAEAAGTFGTGSNKTDLVFATGNSETAVEKMRLFSAGNVQFKHAGVSHGVTGVMPTDVWGEIVQVTTNAGGMRLNGINDTAGNNPFEIYAGFGSTTPDDDEPAFSIHTFKRNGTTGTDLGDLETVYQVINWSATLYTLLGSGNAGFGTVTPAQKIEVEDANALTAVQISNTATDGDAALLFALSGTVTWSLGLDDGDSDKLKIGTSAIGTGTVFTLDSAATIANKVGLILDSADQVSLTSANGSTWRMLQTQAVTIDWDGGTLITATDGLVMHLGAITQTADQATTVTTASTLYVANPVAGANITITNNYPINTEAAAFLTVAGVWTDNPSTREKKHDIEDTTHAQMKQALGEIRGRAWKYNDEWDDDNRIRFGIVAEEQPRFLHGLGTTQRNVVQASMMSGFALAGLSYHEQRIDVLEAEIARLKAV